MAEQVGASGCVVYDGRISSPGVAEGVIRGLRRSGLAVLDIGLGPTPALYFATRSLGADGGIMVTGSHNPSNYNGFKMVVGKAPFWGKAIQELGARAERGDWISGAGRVFEIELLDHRSEEPRVGEGLVSTGR